MLILLANWRRVYIAKFYWVEIKTEKIVSESEIKGYFNLIEAFFNFKLKKKDYIDVK